MGPIFNPLLEFRNRIDILKRVNVLPRWAHATLDRKIYNVEPNGQIVRSVPKKLSKYALRKNTKRARKAVA